MFLILTAIYLLAMGLAGWRLRAMRWTMAWKLVASAGIICPVPLLFLLPPLLHPERPFADVLRGLGLVLMLCGAISFAAGMGVGWLRARRP